MYSTLQTIHVGMNRFVLKMIEHRNHSDLVMNESLTRLISLLQTIEDLDTVKSVVSKIKSRVVALYVLENCTDAFDVDDSFDVVSSDDTSDAKINLETLLARRIAIRKTQRYLIRPFETRVEIDSRLTKDLPSHVHVSDAIFLSDTFSEYQEDSVTDLCRLYRIRDEKKTKMIREILKDFEEKDLEIDSVRIRLDHDEFLNTSELVERILRDLCPELWGALRVGQCPILHITSIWWRRRFYGLLPARLVSLFSLLCRYASKQLCRVHFTLTCLFHLKARIFESASGISDLPLCVLIQRPLPLKKISTFWIREIDKAILLFIGKGN